MSLRTTLLGCLTAIACVAMILAYVHKYLRYQIIGNDNAVFVLDRQTTLLHHCNKQNCQLITPQGTNLEQMRQLAGIPTSQQIMEQQKQQQIQKCRCDSEKNDLFPQVKLNVTSFQSLEPQVISPKDLQQRQQNMAQQINMPVMVEQQQPQQPFPSRDANPQIIKTGGVQPQSQNSNNSGGSSGDSSGGSYGSSSGGSSGDSSGGSYGSSSGGSSSDSSSSGYGSGSSGGSSGDSSGGSYGSSSGGSSGDSSGGGYGSSSGGSSGDSSGGSYGSSSGGSSGDSSSSNSGSSSGGSSSDSSGSSYGSSSGGSSGDSSGGSYGSSSGGSSGDSSSAYPTVGDAQQSSSSGVPAIPNMPSSM